MDRYNDGYYHFDNDLLDYPEAWLYAVYSRRGPGKTYSALKYSYEQNIPIIYMKRTIEDVEMICAHNEYGFDPSPYSPINRDTGYNIKPILIKRGLGAFYNMSDDGIPEGLPVGYILAANGIKKFKGFDFSRCEWIIFDEFIPQIGERTSAGNKEGELLLDLYMTVARDRQKRHLPMLKLVMFANAEEIATPITNELEIVDDIANLNANGNSHYYNAERGMLIHHITTSEIPVTEEERTGIYQAMRHTAWGRKSFEGEFSNNDFSNIIKLPLKGFKPMIHLMYRTHDYYIYTNGCGKWYMCESRGKCIYEYDLRKENDQKKFFLEHAINLRLECIDDNFKFQKYSMYDLIINYKKKFNL